MLAMPGVLLLRDADARHEPAIGVR